MYSDFHLHTSFSSDSQEKAEIQIQQAIRLGMTHICITDHQDFDFPQKYSMTYQFDTVPYFETLKQLQKQFQEQINLNIGVELGLKLGLSEKLKNYTQKYPFDFVIGSLHLVNDVDIMAPEYFEKKTQQEAYREYFETLYANLNNDIDIDVVGHIDYVVRYGSRSTPCNYKDYWEILDAILKLAIDKNWGIECNTGGFRAGLNTPNPNPLILKHYRELGGEILTIGSDAHTHNYVGSHFEQLTDLLKACGFRYYTIFKNRKPEFLPL